MVAKKAVIPRGMSIEQFFSDYTTSEGYSHLGNHTDTPLVVSRFDINFIDYVSKHGKIDSNKLRKRLRKDQHEWIIKNNLLLEDLIIGSSPSKYGNLSLPHHDALAVYNPDLLEKKEGFPGYGIALYSPVPLKTFLDAKVGVFLPEFNQNGGKNKYLSKNI